MIGDPLGRESGLVQGRRHARGSAPEEEQL
jgi:hypothetical protein